MTRLLPFRYTSSSSPVSGSAATRGRASQLRWARRDRRCIHSPSPARNRSRPTAHAAVDARPDSVSRVVYVDSEPLAAGSAMNGELPVADREAPLPDWSVFEEADLTDLADELREHFRRIAVPEPLGVTRDARRAGSHRPAPIRRSGHRISLQHARPPSPRSSTGVSRCWPLRGGPRSKGRGSSRARPSARIVIVPLPSDPSRSPATRTTESTNFAERHGC